MAWLSSDHFQDTWLNKMETFLWPDPAEDASPMVVMLDGSPDARFANLCETKFTTPMNKVITFIRDCKKHCLPSRKSIG